MVLVTRNVLNGSAVAVKGQAVYQDKHEVVSKGYRNFFVTPWQGQSLIGTWYEPYDGDPADVSVSADDVRRYVAEFNSTYPTAKLGVDEVKWVYTGLLPLAEGAAPDDPQYQKQYAILDHQSQNGTPGLVSVVGVKWTTARDVAQKTVDRVGLCSTGRCRRARPPTRRWSAAGTPITTPSWPRAGPNAPKT